jgi:hypothetical protein
MMMTTSQRVMGFDDRQAARVQSRRREKTTTSKTFEEKTWLKRPLKAQKRARQEVDGVASMRTADLLLMMMMMTTGFSWLDLMMKENEAAVILQ